MRKLVDIMYEGVLKIFCVIAGLTRNPILTLRTQGPCVPTPTLPLSNATRCVPTFGVNNGVIGMV